jgi:cellulose synthase/poly-beta-1,6-N-acetylglucosamine synthase-like glycosyltransferase
MAQALIPILLICLCVLLLAPTIVLFVEVVAAIMPGRMPSIAIGSRPERVAVLIPAHDEETSIVRTLRSIAPQLGRKDRLLVVADNCSDLTGEVARREGAEVLTRENLELRGKGYALDHGVRHLEQDAPDVVVIIDADCIVEPGSIAILAANAMASGRPVQALYRMHAPEPAGLRARIAEFAWLVKNQVRPLGLHRMGLPCQLMGTGMAFPWTCIRTAPLATGHIVEDLKLGLDLAREGRPPLFCPRVQISSEFPTSNEGIHSQRMRWEHGHLGSILEQAPELLFQSVLRRDAFLAAMALDMSVPPLALLAMLIAAGWLTCLSVMMATRASLPLLIIAATTLLFGSAVTLAWQRFGRRTVSGGDLALAAIYAICKVPMYLRFILKPQSKWVRSKRG